MQCVMLVHTWIHFEDNLPQFSPMLTDCWTLRMSTPRQHQSEHYDNTMARVLLRYG